MFLSPTDVVTYLPVSRGMRVADFGAGSGVCTDALLAKLEREGALYAFDIMPGHVEALHKKAVREHVANLFPLRADLNVRIPLKDALLNTSLVVNVLHAIKDRTRFLSELNRVSVRGASALIVEWASSFKNTGPVEEAVIDPGSAVRLFKAHGFRVGEMLPAGTHHYAFIATKV